MRSNRIVRTACVALLFGGGLVIPAGTSAASTGEASPLLSYYFGVVPGRGMAVDDGVFIRDLASGHDYTAIPRTNAYVDDPAISPDGNWLVFVGPGGLELLPVTGGAPRQITVAPHRQADYHPAWHPDSTKIVFSRTPAGPDESRQLLVFNLATGNSTAIPGTDGVFPAYSPDGSQIVFSDLNTGTVRTALTVINTDGTVVRRLREGGMQAAWSPDGTRIAFVDYGNPKGGEALYTIRVDGTDDRIVQGSIFEHPSETSSPTWSADSQTLYFAQGRSFSWAEGSGDKDIWATSADGGAVDRRIVIGSPENDDRDEKSPQLVHAQYNGGVFHDVPITHPHRPAIQLVADKGIASGTTATTYSPDAPVNRGQMATFLARSQGLSPQGSTRFSDVAPDNVHAGAISAIADQGWATGRSDGTFGPFDPVTREQMATFLDRAFGPLPDAPPGAFSDTAGSVHRLAIDRVAAAGIARGPGDGTYRPAESVTRGQMATFLFRAVGREQ
jgi:hypothetical protein